MGRTAFLKLSWFVAPFQRLSTLMAPAHLFQYHGSAI